MPVSRTYTKVGVDVWNCFVLKTPTQYNKRKSTVTKTTFSDYGYRKRRDDEDDAMEQEFRELMDEVDGKALYP